MEKLFALLALFVVVAGIALLIKIKMPSRVPKRIVLEPILTANETIFNTRLAINTIISETMSLYSPGYNQANIQDRQNSITRQFADVRKQLTLFEERYKTYAGIRSEKGFYELCVSSKEAVSQAVDTLEDFSRDLVLLQEAMLQMRRLHEESGNPILTQYVDEHEPHSKVVHDVGTQIEKIISIAHELVASTNGKQFIFAESQQVGLSIAELAYEFANEYQRLRNVLSRDIPAFRMASMTIPMLSSQYNGSSYDTTLRSVVERAPEALLVEEVRRVSYQV